jgi:penicillin-binding protein 1A
VQGAWPSSDPRAAIIWEAFKPESEPRRTVREEEVAPVAPTRRRAPRRTEAPAEQSNQPSDFLQDQGGIY